MKRHFHPGKFDSLTVNEFAELMRVEARTVRNWMNRNGLPFVQAPGERLINGAIGVAWHFVTKPSLGGKEADKARTSRTFQAPNRGCRFVPSAARPPLGYKDGQSSAELA